MQHHEFQEQNNLPAQCTSTSKFLNALQRASTIGEAGGPMREVALALVAGGWPVFPCGQNKKPLIRQGFNGRSADPAEVARWWTKYPDAMPGIVPGDGGLGALDVDSENAARAVQARRISLDTGFVVLTAGTSTPFTYQCTIWLPRHIYVRVNEQPRIGKVVARYLGGYVIAPGARHGDRIYAVSSSDEPAQWTDGGETAIPKVSVGHPIQGLPDLQRVREAVACIPNNSNTDREAYVLMAHLIKGSAGEAGREIFLEWAAKWEGDVDKTEDARVWDTLGEPRVGWDALQRHATRFGFDAHVETDGAPPGIAEELSTVCIADVAPEIVEWLWDGYIPQGKLTILDGDPGVGKSTLTLDLAARVSRGQHMPDGSQCEAGSVLLLTAEDGLGDTVRPRLEIAGADLTRIMAVKAESLPTFPESVDRIREKIRDIGASYVIVDPLSDYFSSKLNPWKDQDCRRALTPLARVADETGAAILVVRHFTKGSDGQAIHRGGGSIGMIAVARSGLILADDPDLEGRRVLAVAKCNLGPRPPSLAFHLESVVIEIRGVPQEFGKAIWDGPSAHSADALIALKRGEPAGQVAEIGSFLGDLLPLPAAHVYEACRNAGFDVSQRTIRRAATQIGVHMERVGFGPGSYVMWYPPGQTDLSQEQRWFDTPDLYNNTKSNTGAA